MADRPRRIDSMAERFSGPSKRISAGAAGRASPGYPKQGRIA
ncbi:hypothetical protein [Bradyrhizobium sp.]